MVVGRGTVPDNIEFRFPMELLVPERSFVRRNYVWVPIMHFSKTCFWLCIKAIEYKEDLVYKTIIAFKVSNNADFSYLRVYLSAGEIFELIFSDGMISKLLKTLLKNT